MPFHADAGGTRFSFATLADLLAKATPARSGDQLAGLAASTPVERVAAQMALADLPLGAFLDEALVPYEADEVTRLILDTHDRAAFALVSHLTVGAFREWLLEAETPALSTLAPGLTPEMVAAVSKLMRLSDLIAVAAKLSVVTHFRTTIGLPDRLALRNQPNSPTDDLLGIAASALDGLVMGSGDAVVGVNPAGDGVETYTAIVQLLDDLRAHLGAPIQCCCLGHVTAAVAAIGRGAPVDLVFQSVAGSEKANRGFGIDLALLAEAHDAVRSLGRARPSANLTYFETGQGSALSADAHHGIDQQTMECRAYAVARHFSPLLVNTVVGFIGPEYLATAKEIIRAGLEDHFCGKLMGLPMGVDVCYTNHAEADGDDTDALLTLLVAAGVAFVITVPGADDVMLNYQSLSHHDGLYAREALKRRAAPEFEAWAIGMGLMDEAGRLKRGAGEQALGRALSTLPMLGRAA